MDQSPRFFQTQITFPRRDNPAFASEKAYAFDYDPGTGIPRTNITLEVVQNIMVQDLRSASLSFSKNGVSITPLLTSLQYSEFDDTEKIETCYLKEARDCIKKFLGSDDVRIIDWNIRRRHSIFPKSTGLPYDAAQPVVVAHGDFTPWDALDRIKILFGEEAELKAKKSFQIVNLWKPLRGPVRDWPLAFCDPLTMNYERDTLRLDAIFTDTIGEAFNIFHSPEQKWYSLSDQAESEALIFNGYDSRYPTQYGVPHCAVEYPFKSEKDCIRESVEVRAIAFFHETQ